MPETRMTWTASARLSLNGRVKHETTARTIRVFSVIDLCDADSGTRQGIAKLFSKIRSLIILLNFSLSSCVLVPTS